MKKISLSVAIALILASFLLAQNAYAFKTTVSFAPLGDKDYTEFNLFQLTSLNNPFEFKNDVINISGPKGDFNSGDTTNGHFFSKTDLSTGDFNESFTVQVPTGEDTSFNNVAFSDIFLDLVLGGNVDETTNTVKFTSGQADMYYDNGSTTNNIATFDLESAIPTVLTGSVIGDAKFGMKVDLNFSFSTMNHPAYWGDDENALTDLNWLLSMTTGSVEAENVWKNTDETYNITQWQYAGSQMEFEAVPEPTTLLLFGTGLLGLAAFGRKKFIKKS